MNLRCSAVVAALLSALAALAAACGSGADERNVPPDPEIAWLDHVCASVRLFPATPPAPEATP
jgi:hypothetical protein